MLLYQRLNDIRYFVDKGSRKCTILKRRPGLNRHLLAPRVFQQSPIMIERGRIGHIGMQTKINHPRVHDRKLQLVNQQPLGAGLLQQFNLLRVEVGNAKVPHLAGFLQLIKSRGYFFR